MKSRLVVFNFAVILMAVSLASAGDSPDQKRDKTHKMASTTLEDLYALQPAARGVIQKSAGYAVFNNIGTNVLVVSTARGTGFPATSRISMTGSTGEPARRAFTSTTRRSPFFAWKRTICESLGFRRMPSAVAGTRSSAPFAGSTTTEGNSSTRTDVLPSGGSLD